MRKKQLVKIAAWLIVFIFTLGEVCPAQFAQSAPLLNNISPPLALSGTRIQIPHTFGEVSNAYQGESDLIFVFIQDAHANYEAQLNIAHIIDYLHKNHQLAQVHVEGAEGKLYSEFLSAYPNVEARRRVADHFLKNAKLSGPVYAAIVDVPGLELFGVEDEAVYEENRRVFLEALEYKHEDERAVLTPLHPLLGLDFSFDLKDHEIRVPILDICFFSKS